MLIPWLAYYALFIPTLLGSGISNALLQEKDSYKYYSIVFICMACLYMCLWVSVFRLYKTGGLKKNVIMKGFGDIFLEPLTSKVSAYVQESQPETKTQENI